MNAEQILQTEPKLLMEAAIAERVRRAHPEHIHPRLATSLLIQSLEGREILRGFVREYIAIARTAGLPIVLGTPTWRLDRLRSAENNISEDLNNRAVAFEMEFKQEYANVLIAGQIGCKNDCYKPEEALSTGEAFDFHAWQIERLTQADFLYAVTLPDVGEALGIAQAMAATGRPYLISFVIGKDGRILDGTSLEQAIETIDSATQRSPTGYGVNCCYPAFLQASELSGNAAGRMISIQANASSLSHAELDASPSLKSDSVEDWAERMLDLHRNPGIQMLGGCCGTTGEHLKTLI
ncbi:homocysteine S-methyltransferase family protein [Pontiella agarivorans]|uniref:Homocysteine S-methyltransferase family protein n=1 Tax=Pontiella agarivorans TaxID=3038953 RepID=A0ABU5MVV6_9BACT|nr:homocysteine S-methyltransferase family protein [Pontiella agarivorans]MDZ8118334.1 homocysteine S-methyltransferase family protein [Pontiella agarivorans]